MRKIGSKDFPIWSIARHCISTADLFGKCGVIFQRLTRKYERKQIIGESKIKTYIFFIFSFMFYNTAFVGLSRCVYACVNYYQRGVHHFPLRETSAIRKAPNFPVCALCNLIKTSLWIITLFCYSRECYSPTHCFRTEDPESSEGV